MFKTNLVQWLQNKGEKTSEVMRTLGAFVKTGVFLRCFNSHNLTICELRPTELEKAIEVIFESTKEAQN